MLLYLLDFDFLLFVFTKFYSYACYARKNFALHVVPYIYMYAVAMLIMTWLHIIYI